MSRVIKAHQLTVALPDQTSGERQSDNDALSGASKQSRPETEAGCETIEKAATALLNEARQQARKLLAHSQRIVERRLARVAEMEASIEQTLDKTRQMGRQQGYEDGYRAGFEQGREEALDEYRRVINSALATLDEAREIQRRMQREAEEDIVKLAVAMAEKLVRKTLVMDDDAMLAILHEMLAKVEGSPTARVRLPAEVYERLLKEAQLPASTPDGCVLEFLPDTSLQKGDVVIETQWGLIDGRIQSRWQRIIQGLDLAELSADDPV